MSGMNFSHTIRTLGMLRSRFQSVPDQFSKRLVPNNEGGCRKSKQDKEEIERRNIANFPHIWNEFIYSLQNEDLINNMVVRDVCKAVDDSRENRQLLMNFRMSELPQLSTKVEKFLTLLVCLDL